MSWRASQQAFAENPKPKDQVLEGVAFQFCKVATVALIAGRFALPLAAALCALFYGLAWRAGAKDTRCVLGKPIIVAAFWSFIFVGWCVLFLRPDWVPSQIAWRP